MKQDHFPGREGARTATAIVAAAGLALLVAACGGSGSASPGVATLPSPSAGSAAPASTTGTPNASDEIAQALAYAQCMRSNGVPNWPDPDSSGVFPKSQIDHLGVSDARLQSAEDACRDLLPSGGQTGAQYVQQLRARALAYAQCMRSHGVPNFPDPGSDGHFPDAQLHALDQGSPEFQTAYTACANVGTPGPGPSGS